MRISDELRVRVVTILFALFITVPAINDIFVAVFSRSAMIVLYLGVILLILCFSITKKMVFDFKMLFFLLYILVFYFLTIAFGASRIDVQYFLVYFASSFFLFSICLQNKLIDIKLLLFSMSAIPIPGIIFINKIFILESSTGMSMGSSYNFLTPVFSCLTYMVFYYFENKKKLYRILYLLICVINLVYAYELVAHGSRGPLLCILVFAIFCTIFKYSKLFKRIKVRKVALLITLLTVSLLLGTIWYLLDFISSFVKIEFVEKLIRLKINGDLLNNRGIIYSSCLGMVPDSLLFGHGISTFQYYTNEVYPHNLFLQLLFDGGIVLFLSFMIPLIISFKRLFTLTEKNTYILFIFLFCIAVVKSLVSGDIWENDKLWMFFALCLFMIREPVLKNKCALIKV